MKLYLLTRTDHGGYDTYDSFVVAAESEKNALYYLPDGNKKDSEDFERWGYDGWTSEENIKVKCIGKSNSKVEGVIIASFNAG